MSDHPESRKQYHWKQGRVSIQSDPADMTFVLGDSMADEEMDPWYTYL